MLCLLERVPAFRDLESEILNLNSSVESISKQLGAWIRTLRDSEMKGHCYVTEKTRRATQARQEREEFLRQLEQIQKANAPRTEKPCDESASFLESKIRNLRCDTRPACKADGAKKKFDSLLGS